MKERELRKHATCTACGNRIGHTGLPLFSVVTIERHGIKLDSVRRQDGLAAMLGNPCLAGVMGPDDEMTECLGSAKVTLCESCVATLPVLELLAAREVSKWKSR